MAGTIDWERIEDAATHPTRPSYSSWSQPGRAAASSRPPDPRTRAAEGGSSPPSPLDTALSGALDPGSAQAGELDPSSTPLKSRYAMLLGIPLAAATAWSCVARCYRWFACAPCTPWSPTCPIASAWWW